MRSRAVARLAVVGLTIGLSALATLALYGTASTAQTTSHVRANDEVIERWDSVFLHMSVEYEALGDFVRAKSELGRRPLASAVGSARPSLEWLVRNASGVDARQAATVRDSYEAHTQTLQRMVEAGSRGNTKQVTLLAEQASLSAAAVRKQVVANTTRKRLEMKEYLVTVDRNTRTLRLAAAALGGFDFLLLLLSGAVLLGYQRHIERQALESRHQSLHDGLTGIANRILLNDRISVALRQAERHTDVVALLLLDLNRFKEVNDTLGHHHGDLLLQEVALRLGQTMRGGDTVARLGGDEFAVLLPRVSDAQTAMSVARRVLDVLQRPADLDGTLVDVSASIGMALHPEHSATPAELLRHADIAMYTAKRGHLGVACYDPSTDRHTSTEDLSLLTELRQAIDRDELVLHYQPKAYADGGRTQGVEALARWQHPRRGLLGPAAFIAVAEQSELIDALTDHVLATALRQQRTWRVDGGQVPVAVNVATRRLLDTAFPDRVAELLAEYDAAAGDLTLEITESTVIADPPRTMAVLGRLHEMGVRISIDDFGTGHSSMAYLQQMPLDELKIDRRFVAGIRSSGADLAIVRAILQLGHALELRVVAEGVEDAETWSALYAMGCDVIQGYHLGRPMPAEDVPAWLRERDRATV